MNIAIAATPSWQTLVLGGFGLGVSYWNGQPCGPCFVESNSTWLHGVDLRRLRDDVLGGLHPRPSSAGAWAANYFGILGGCPVRLDTLISEREESL